MKPKLRVVRLNSAWLSTMTIALSVPLADAQTSSTPAAGETIELPSFVVSSAKDTGYIAGDTMSVSRLATTLLKTPNDISILTSQFIADIGTTNIADAELYLTGAAPVAPSNDGYTFGTDFLSRGLPTSNNLRNGFNQQTATINQYIVDRLEGMRGSNSLLIGPSNIGGLVNVLTKKAEFRDFGSVGAFVDSEGTKGATIDVNRKLNDKLAARVNAVDQKEQNWVNGYYNKVRAADITVTYRPFTNTEIRFESELSYRETAAQSSNMTDNASNWNGVGVVGPSKTAPVGSTGVAMKTSDYLVYSPSVWNGVMNFNGYGVSSGSGLAVLNGAFRPTAAFNVLVPKEFRSAPADAFSIQKNRVFQLNIQQKLPGDGVFELAGFHVEAPGSRYSVTFGNVSVDVNQFLPDGTANPEYGKLYSEDTITGNNSHGIQVDQYRTNLRAAIAYPLKTQWGRQDFSFVADQWGQQFFPTSLGLGRINNPADPNVTSSANRLQFRQYWDKPNNNLLDTFPILSGSDQFGWITIRRQHSGSTLHGYSLNTSGNWFNDSLSVVGGIRRDFMSTYAQDIATKAKNGDPATFATSRYRTVVTSGNAGLVYFPVKYLGAYADYQKGFNPITASISGSPTLDGKAPPSNTRVSGKSAGLRLRLLDGKVVGSIGYYTIEEAGRLITPSTSDVNSIWNHLNLAQNAIPASVYADTQSYKGSGLEADLTANLTKNLSVLFNYSRPKTEQTAGGTGLLTYYNANIANWQTLAAQQSAADQTAISNSIQNILNAISGYANGRTLNGTPEYTATAFGRYNFSQGPLKGFRIGGGARIYGRQLIGNPTGQSFNYLYSRAYSIFELTSGYTFKLADRRQVDLQVNVKNLFNYDKPVYTNTTTLSGVNYYNNYYYNAPLYATVKLSYSF